jgi:YD repeat-containing protein
MNFTNFLTIILTLFFLEIQTGLSQEYWQMEKVVPPEAFRFDLAVKSEVGATGALSVNIPLLTVPGRAGLDMPLNLSYTSGIKTRQQSTWVGLGWNFDLGSITRVVHALPDYDQVTYENRPIQADYPDYYVVSIPELTTTMFQTATSGSNLSFLLESYNDWKIEYDTAMYTGLRMGYDAASFKDQDFSTNGLRIDNNPLNGVNNGNRQIDYVDIDKFILTSPNGTKYVFGLPLKSEMVMPMYISAGNVPDFVMEYNSNWRLTAILSPDYVDGGGDPYNPLDVNEESCKGSWVFIQYYYLTNMRLVNGANPNLLMQITYPAVVYTPSHRASFITFDNVDIGYFMPDCYHQYGSNYSIGAYQGVARSGVNDPIATYDPQRLDSIILYERSTNKRLRGVKFKYVPDGDSRMLCANGGSYTIPYQWAQNFYNPTSIHAYANVMRTADVHRSPILALSVEPIEGGGGGGGSGGISGSNNYSFGKLTLVELSPFDGADQLEPGYKFKYKDFNPFYYITRYLPLNNNPIEFTSGVPDNFLLGPWDPNQYFRRRTDRFGYFYALDTELSAQGYTDPQNEVRQTNGAIAYSLERITFPTGGYEEYVYELNKFSASDKSEANWGIGSNGNLTLMLNSFQHGLDPDRECGIRLKTKKIVESTGNEIVINYQYGTNGTVDGRGHLSCPPMSAWRRATNNLFKQFDRGKNVVEYDFVDEVYSDNSKQRKTYNSGTFEFNKQAVFPAAIVGGTNNWLLIETSYDWKRNSLTKIEHKTNAANTIGSTSMTFDHPVISQTGVQVTKVGGSVYYMTLFSGLVRKTTETATEYDQNGGSPISKTTIYAYPTNSPYPTTVTESIDGLSSYLKRITKLKYVRDFTTTAGTIGLMKSLNIINPVIEKTVYKDSESANNVVYSEGKEWSTTTLGGQNKPKPYKLYRWRGTGSFAPVSENVSTGGLTFHSNYLTQATINSYDNYGNFPTSITDALNVTTTFEWSDTYKGSRLTKRGLAKTDGTQLYQNYQYNSYYQVSEIKDENDQRTNYEYDGFGRLIKVKGPNQETLKDILYHFKEN